MTSVKVEPHWLHYAVVSL